ncbi:MAG: SPOR domain-containing protein [Guyparkeria sp.]|uniref:SPOR domain-containing protein n=1 Tax=Guyparkeria sp. TaxID=2035736 RepID=UPI00397B90EF
MTEATEHALEQAERIVQYAKYSDRFMVVEGDSAAERRAFVKLIGQKLPRQVRPVVLRADSGNGSAALIDQLSTLLQLSAGIETIDQLINAATAALEGQERLLIVVENADHWLASDAADALFDLITQAHELAPERILFLLVGAAGLCEQIETAQPLAGLVADLHCAQLLGTTRPTTAANATAGSATNKTAATANQPASATATTERDTSHRKPAGQPLWASPTLLIAAVTVVAVIAIGLFALLGRSDDPPRDTSAPPAAAEQTDESAPDSEASEEAADSDEASGGASVSDEASVDDDADRERANDGDAADATDTRQESATLPDHGLPLHVPFPDESARPEADEEDETTDDASDRAAGPSAKATDADADSGSEATSPVETDARGDTAATPPVDVDNAWFREQPRARAAIQLAAFGKLDGAEAMIDRYASEAHPREEWRIYTQSISGKVLYTVTFGDFASTERAAHAIDSLPDELRELKPYPRSVGAIQDRLTDVSD